MRASRPFFETTFAAVIAWGVLFHLTPRDQELAIAKVARCLVPADAFSPTPKA